MFTASVTLRSPAFGQRLQALIAELKQFGGVVWLKGLTLHVEVPRRPRPRTVRELQTLLSDYGDVVECPFEKPQPNRREADSVRHSRWGYRMARGA